ncbi:hypothetical protein N0V82_009008 [Gnomoniopsis sp. IMI 355080]|nr:hypothetical protein N0V82_009008 [Gnomoniopsis sp. IMI 355080]
MRRQKLWWDDWLCITSMFWNFGTLAVIMVEMDVNGMGSYEENLTSSQIARLIKIFLIGEIVYASNVAITKISVLLLYYRLLQVAFQTSRTLRSIAYGIAALVVTAALVFIFMGIFSCDPVQKQWQPELPGYCMGHIVRWTLNAGLSILSDVMILTLPLPQIWKMRLGRLEKIGVTSIFALGWCVTFISAYRVHLLIAFMNTDFSYNIVPVVVWSYTEIVIGLVSACLPVSKPAALWVTHRLGITGKEACFSCLGSAKSSQGGSSSNDTAVNTDASREQQQSNKGLSTPSATQPAGRMSRTGSVGNSRYLWLSEDTLASGTMASELSPISTDKRVEDFV